MKKTNFFLPVVTLGLLLSMGLVACNQENQGSKSSTAPTTSTPAQEKITIEKGSEQFSLKQDLTLTASVAGVTWKSSDEKIATVTSTGDKTAKVHALAYGDVTISAEKEGYTKGAISLTVPRPEPIGTLDLTEADHYSKDGWWGTTMSMGGMTFETGPGATPVNVGYGDDANSYLSSFGEGDIETVKFTSSKAIKAQLVVTMGASSAVTISEAMAIKFNNKDVATQGLALEGSDDGMGGFGTPTFEEVNLGQFDLVAGENTLVFTMHDGAPSMDELVVYAEESATLTMVPSTRQSVAVTKEKIDLIVESTEQIACTTQGVTYESQDETVASVSNTGLITAVKTGMTTIRVKKDGLFTAVVSVTVQPKPVTGQIIIEAEDAEELADVTPGWSMSGGPMIMEDGGMGMGGNEVHSGGKYVTAFGGEELTLTIKFTAREAKTMVLSVVGSAPMSMGGDAAAFVFADSMSVKLNGTAVPAAAGAEFPAPEGYSSTMSEVVIGDVAVKAGENTLLVEITGSIPSLDCFKLSLKA